MFDLVNAVIESRRAEESAPTLAALRDVQAEAAQDATPKAVKARIDNTLETMQLFDDWYGDVLRLPRPVQLSVIRLGGRIAHFLPKGKSKTPES